MITASTLQIAQRFGKSIIYMIVLQLSVLNSIAGDFVAELPEKRVRIADHWFYLEVADTPELRTKGLMYRDELAVDRGMLFDYLHEGNFRIWMKNTRIPLLVLWVDRHSKIQAVKRLYPCGTGACLSFGVAQKSRYVIELNASVTGIEPGMLVSGLD